MSKRKIPPSRRPKKKEKTLPAKKKTQASSETICGTLHLHPRGFGFVAQDAPARYPQDIFIPKHLTDSAVDGDTVEVEVDPHSNWDKGPEGRITAILKRGRTHLAGTVRAIGPAGEFIAHVPLLGSSKPVIVRISQDGALKVGDRIIMKVTEWGDEQSGAICELSHLIGHISDPSIDIQAAIEEFDILNHFPKAAIEQAQEFGKKVLAKDQKKRVDLTSLNTLTIDPDTAKDFDDALSLTKDKKGVYHLGVHIADVAHYVPPGSPLDLQAAKRCNSTYFPGRCVPMLPEELSNHLCSLRPDVIRLTVSVLMDFDKEGNLLSHQVVRSFIESKKRFTYQEAKEVLDGKLKSPHKESLELMVELCLMLKKKRHARGSVDFSLPEMVIQVDEKGDPFGVKWVEYDITHQLVEEYMLKANEIVAKHLSDKGKELPYRVHEEPSEENLQDFFAMARLLGFTVPPKPTYQDIQHLFQEAKVTPFAQQLFIGFIRSMKLATYSSDNVGHYGLALEYYCHFTSPIRRYTDLIVERLLFEEEGKELDLKKVSLKCSEQERVSFRAESSVKLLKKLRLLQKQQLADPAKEYAAIVTRIKPFGLFFEASELQIEGFLHISQLENDYFIYDQRRSVLFGRASGRVHAIGESLKVIPESVDLILLESKWRLPEGRARAKEKRKRR